MARKPKRKRVMPIANWKDEQAYPRGNKISARRWAWEFLRRNPNYQEDWAKVVARWKEILPNFEPDKVLSDNEAAMIEDERFDLFEPPKLPKETDDQWIERVGRGFKAPLHSLLAKKWGLLTMISPALNYPWTIHFESGVAARFVNQHWDGFKLGRMIGPQAAMAFDLTKPLKPQLRAAGVALADRQKYLETKGALKVRRPRLNPEKYPNYLRLLDALAAGAKNSEIAVRLLPTVANAYPKFSAAHRLKDMKSAAIELRDGGYVSLLACG
jgi:hypothetical protein